MTTAENGQLSLKLKTLNGELSQPGLSYSPLSWYQYHPYHDTSITPIMVPASPKAELTAAELTCMSYHTTAPRQTAEWTMVESDRLSTDHQTVHHAALQSWFILFLFCLFSPGWLRKRLKTTLKHTTSILLHTNYSSLWLLCTYVLGLSMYLLYFRTFKMKMFVIGLHQKNTPHLYVISKMVTFWSLSPTLF